MKATVLAFVPICLIWLALLLYDIQAHSIKALQDSSTLE